MVEVWVIGFMRSGNHWMSWLLSDLLSAPIQERPGYQEKRHMASEIIEDRFCVRLGHLRPKEYDNLITRPSLVVHMIRDPRDVIVSLRHFKKFSTVEETIEYAKSQNYSRQVWEWEERFPAMTIFYEDLVNNTSRHLRLLSEKLGNGAIDFYRAKDIENRQSIEITKKKFPDIVRTGRSGSWIHEFTTEDAVRVMYEFGDIIDHYGYSDPDGQWPSYAQKDIQNAGWSWT